jgi:prepilin-type N-terminal cleavage/methylation domain-containing protein
MKTPPSRARRGFTLVELLVVIAIIAVLAAAGFAAGNKAMNSARKTTAQASATSLQQAINSFYNDNGSLPDVGTGGGGGQDTQVRTDGGDGVLLLQVLLGKEPASGGGGGVGGQVQNTRGVKYLEVKEAKQGRRRDGLAYGNDQRSIIGLYDPWGTPYTVVLDTSYDDTLEFNLGGPVRLNGRRVAVYSPGSDRNLGTKEDVKTW